MRVIIYLLKAPQWMVVEVSMNKHYGSKLWFEVRCIKRGDCRVDALRDEWVASRVEEELGGHFIARFRRHINRSGRMREMSVTSKAIQAVDATLFAGH